MSVSFLWLRLGTLVMRRLDSCAFQPPAQSGSCSVGAAQVVLRRPFSADPDRPRQSKLDVVSDFLKGQSDAAPDITMSELATVLFERHTIRATPAMLSRHLIHRLNYTYKKSLIATERRREQGRAARYEWTHRRQPRMRLVPHRLIFTDETAVTTKMTRLRGRSLHPAP